MGDIMARLSGWKRLWLVLAVFYFIPVAIFTVSEMPKRSKIMYQWAFDTLAVESKYDDSSNIDWYEPWEEEKKGISFYQEIIERINTKFLNDNDNGDKGKWAKIADKIKLKEIGEKYTKKLANINRDRARIVGIGFLFWIVPVVVVYILGLTVRWIYIGFKTDYSKKG